MQNNEMYLLELKLKLQSVALQRIADWNELSAEYKLDWGSRGERDYYRTLALNCLEEIRSLDE